MLILVSLSRQHNTFTLSGPFYDRSIPIIAGCLVNLLHYYIVVFYI